MLDNKLKLKILQSILESPTFKDAYRLRDLLDYLVKESIAGNKPKEATIAMEVLGKDKDFDSKDDAIVRVYVNNLRNKLEHHYLTTPAIAPGFILRIPKGSYEVVFEPVTEIRDSKKKYIIGLLLSVIVILAGIVSYLLLRNSQENDSTGKEMTLLESFVSANAKPVLIVIGDFYFMNEEKKQGSEHYNVRDFRINSTEDFLNETKSDPEFKSRFSPGLYTYLRPSAQWGVFKLFSAIKHVQKEIRLKLASQFSADDLKYNNVVYVGQVKSLFMLQKFLPVYAVECNKNNNTASFFRNNPSQPRVFTPSDMFGGKYEKDYAMIIRGTGPEGTELLLLMGFAEIGTLAAANAVTDVKNTQSVWSILKSLNNAKMNDYSLVFESEGLNQTVFNSRLIFAVSRSPKMAIWEAQNSK